MKSMVLGTGLFIIISFTAQSISHFVINAEHYASITFMRAEPVFILGFLTMIMQGLVLSHFFKIYSGKEFTLKKGFIYGLLLCIFFVSYPALVEPAKYQVPSITSWILVEGSVGVVQFTLFGVLLSMLFKKIKV
jgi:hypothetical protein